MKKSDVIKFYGNGAKAARALNMCRTAFYQWGEFVPEQRQYELEVKTNGLLKSDYTIQKLRENNEKI